MRKIFLVLFAISVLASWLSAQSLIDDYGMKPVTKNRQQVVVKFHAALELMNGQFNPEQKAVLLKVIADPKSFDESELSLFTPDQVKQIFYAIGTVDISKFKTVYKISTLADKKLLFLSYDKQGRAGVWRGWLAYNLATRTLPGSQIDLLLASSNLLGQTFTLQQMKADPMTSKQAIALAETAIDNGLAQLEAEIQTEFPKDLARDVFENIGPYTKIGKFCKGASVANLEGGDCVCAKDHYNWSCNDSCGDGGGCQPTDGGCSILWLRNCNGSCSIGLEQ